MPDKITYDRNGHAIGFAGPNAVDLFQAAALRSGLGLMAVGIKPHRSWTSLKVALAKAGQYTGQTYAGKKDIERARSDLAIYCETMKTIIPHEVLK